MFLIWWILSSKKAKVSHNPARADGKFDALCKMNRGFLAQMHKYILQQATPRWILITDKISLFLAGSKYTN